MTIEIVGLDMLDLVYEAAVEPALWVQVMERLGDEIGGGAAILTTINRETGEGSALTARVGEDAVRDYLAYYAGRNPLTQPTRDPGYGRLWRPKVVLDEDLVSRDRFVTTEYYNDFLRPIAAEWKMIFRLDMSGSDLSALVIARPQGKGRFTEEALAKANHLHPHLVRAFALSRKLALTQGLTEGVISGLDASPHGLFVLDETSAVLHVNATAEILLEDNAGLMIKKGRLAAANPNDDQILASLLKNASRVEAGERRGGSMRLRAGGKFATLSINVSPVRSRQVLGFASGPTILVCVERAQDARPSEHTLREMFTLTPAESRVALALFDGLSPREVADRLDVSVNTVRAQLNAIFAKTGTHRQAELVRRIAEGGGAAPEMSRMIKIEDRGEI